MAVAEAVGGAVSTNVIFVIKNMCQRVIENPIRLIKTDFMFLDVDRRFLSIPFKKERHRATFAHSTLGYSELQIKYIWRYPYVRYV